MFFCPTYFLMSQWAGNTFKTVAINTVNRQQYKTSENCGQRCTTISKSQQLETCLCYTLRMATNITGLVNRNSFKTATPYRTTRLDHVVAELPDALDALAFSRSRNRRKDSASSRSSMSTNKNHIISSISYFNIKLEILIKLLANVINLSHVLCIPNEYSQWLAFKEQHHSSNDDQAE